MKILLCAEAAMGLSVSAMAGPYVEAKNQVKFTDFEDATMSGSISHLRMGYQGSNAYIEAGRFRDGSSAEAGYKFKFDNGFTVKGKVESLRIDSWKHAVETEIRYSF